MRSGAFHAAEESSSLALNLTALMDILSNLLFFLLASYTAQSIEVQQKADIHLPDSNSELKLTPSLTITVTKREIQVAGVPVAVIKDNQIVSKVDDTDKILSVFQRLQNARSTRVAMGRGDDLPGQDLVLLLADRNTDSGIITKVMKTAGMAGFVNVKFGVISK